MPINPLHLGIEHGQRVHVDGAERFLNGSFVLGSVILEHARTHISGVRCGPEYVRNPGRPLASPVQPKLAACCRY